jgi:hypothetical protein
VLCVRRPHSRLHPRPRILCEAGNAFGQCTFACLPGNVALHKLFHLDQVALAMAAARGPASARKMQEGVPAKSDLEDMRLQTDALVSEFSEHYRDAVLTPAKTSAHLTPSHKSSSRLESATVVRIPVSSPSNNLIGVTSPHPLSHAPPKNISPPPLRAQQVLTAATAPSASSSDFVYVCSLSFSFVDALASHAAQ